MRPDTDYLIKFPTYDSQNPGAPTTVAGGIVVKGGRNVVIIGGHIRLNDHRWYGTDGRMRKDWLHRGISLSGSTGVVHIEGLLIESPSGNVGDGIYVDAPLAEVQVQHCRVQEIFGYHIPDEDEDEHNAGLVDFHGDAIQTRAVKKLRVDRLSAKSHYQGILLQDEGDVPSLEYTKIKRVNLTALESTAHGQGGYMLWYDETVMGSPARPVTHVLERVHIRPRVSPPPDRALDKTVWPDRDRPHAPSMSGDVLRFDGGGYTILAPNGQPGQVTRAGVPHDPVHYPNGDFVPYASVVNGKYKQSASYQNGTSAIY